MEAKERWVFIRGIDKILERDIAKHNSLLVRSKEELYSYRNSVSQLIRRKKHYRGLVGSSKYDDKALEKSIDMIVIDLRSMSDKAKLSRDAVEHHQTIVDTLTKKLVEYRANEERAARDKAHGTIH